MLVVEPSMACIGQVHSGKVGRGEIVHQTWTWELGRFLLHAVTKFYLFEEAVMPWIWPA